MNWIDKIKSWFKTGGDKVVAMIQGEKYDTIFDHPKINFDPKELKRIEDSFNHYKGAYPQVNYLNVLRKPRQREYFYINMMKVLSNYMSTLVFNEQCEINIGVADKETGDYPETPQSQFAKDVLDRTNLKRNLTDLIEPMFATGGIVVRPYYDAGTKTIDFSWCLADAFIPLRSNTNSISEGVIPTVTTITEGKETYYYTLLEFHEWLDGLYVLSNELYKSKESGKLGERIPLADLDVYKKLDPVTAIPGLSRPLFAYLKPAGYNNLNPRSPLGVGICDNAKPTLKAINDTYDQFRWEIKRGKQRRIVSDHFLSTHEIGEGKPIQYFDDDTDEFIALPGTIDDMVNKDITGAIRSTEYIESLNKFISTLEFQTGISPNTFTYGEIGGVQTATEVISKDSKTYQTRNKHVNEVREFIRDLIITTFELAKFVKVNDKPLFAGEVPKRDEIGVDFDDGVFTDKQSELTFLSTARLNNLIPEVEAMQRLFNVPVATAKEWQNMIREDRLNASPDMTQANAESTMLGQSELGD